MPVVPYNVNQYIIDKFSTLALDTTNIDLNRLTVRFMIKSDGTIDSIKIKKDIPNEWRNEIINIFSSMPKWTPGYQNGTAVNVWYTLPISCIKYD